MTGAYYSHIYNRTFISLSWMKKTIFKEKKTKRHSTNWSKKEAKQAKKKPRIRNTAEFLWYEAIYTYRIKNACTDTCIILPYVRLFHH